MPALTDDEIRQDLAKLKDIVAAHKAPGMPLATQRETIAGQEYEVFSSVPANLYQLFELGRQSADDDFLVYQQERFSFGQSLRMARQVAALLASRYRIAKGDRVAICARNSPEWCLGYMGITLLGAVVVPMNSWWKGAEMQYGLRDSGAKLLLADPARIAEIEPYLGELALDVLAIKAEQNSDYPDFYAAIADQQPLGEAEIAALQVQPEDNASIMYTSGSTGHPKGVLSTHRQIINALYTWCFVKEINEILRPELREENPEFQPAILANVPLFHVTGSHAQFLASFVYQRKFVMMYKWDPEQALQLIEAERISVFHGVPTMTWELMQSPSFASTDLRSLRAVQSGGAPRPPEHLRMMVERFPSKALPGLGYGLTETNAIGAIITGKFYESRPSSTGRPTPPLTAVKIVDEQGEELPNDHVGEICIKGPTVMKGYWNNADATAEVIRDGWFHSGDLGKLDPLGFLIILDRAKDIIIRGGENIGCAEVEYAIAEHPAVAEVSVYGIPDDRLGEVPCATVMLKVDGELDGKALSEFLASRIAAFKIPHHFQFTCDQLPRIASGKIAKKQLRETLMETLGKH